MLVAEELFDRFRTLSFERVRRVEGAWNRVVQDAEGDPGLVGEMLREIHTLKGDAAILGANEILKLCQKLEDLLQLTEELNGSVSEDLELVVTMAMQFLGMLLRMKHGAPMTGLDLDGFVRQCDDVLRETRTLMSQPTRMRRPSGRTNPDAPIDRVAEQTRQRLAFAATNVFLEYMAARGQSSRARLRGVWNTLRQELSRMQVTELGALLDRHGKSTRELATSLGKRVTIDIDVRNVVVEPRIAEAIDIAVLHLVRNAVDHGVEIPADRARVGKPLEGMIRVRSAPAANGNIDIIVEDDGRGIDRVGVHKLALERGVLAAGELDDSRILDAIFEPGFSTKSTVTAISGRGVGLDAVKSSLVRVGGSVRVTSGRTGTAFTLTVPAPVRHIHAYQFLGPGGQVSLAVSARWTPTIEDTPSPDVIDPLATIQVFGASRQTSVQSPAPVRDLCMRLRWGFLEVALRTGTEPRLVIADRICPTSDEHPIEVVSIDGQETLLIRPEHVTEISALWNARERPTALAY